MKKIYFLLTLILIVSFIFNVVSLQEGTDWGGDFAAYIDQTRHLADNQLDKYQDLTMFRFENSSESIAPQFYPWGLPILLVPVYKVFGLNLLAWKIYLLLFFTLSLWVVFHIFKHKLSPPAGLFLVVLLALNPYFFSFKQHILSDYPFLFFSLLSVYLVERFLIRERYLINPWLSYSLLGIVFFAGTFIRSIGHLMVLVFAAVQVIQNYQRGFTRMKTFNFPTLLTYGIYIMLVFFIGGLFPKSSLYLNDFLNADFLNVIYRNLIYYISLPSEFFQVTDSEVFAGVLYGLTIPFLAAGLLVRYKKDYFYLILMVFTYALLLIYPYHQGLRFIFVLVPFTLYFTIRGACWIRNHFISHFQRKVLPFNSVYAFCTVLFVLFIYADIKMMREKNPEIQTGPIISESREMFHYIEKNVSPEKVIIFRKPRVMTLFTGRKSVRKEELDEISLYKGHYLVLDKINNDQQLPVNAAPQANGLKKIFQNNQFDIYQINSPKNKFTELANPEIKKPEKPPLSENDQF
ncbi:MAG: ArnT family glycosyltransferase [Candidatus Cyclobacteriaceae bacterium M3_2C_046]